MSIELTLWREISHLAEVEAVLASVFPHILRRHRWLDGMALFAVEEEHGHLRLTGTIGDGTEEWQTPSRRPLDARGMETWRRWAAYQQPVASHAMTQALRELVGAVTEERNFALIPLVYRNSANGVLVAVAKHGVMPRTLRNLAVYVEPFGCLIRNEQRHRELLRLRSSAEAERKALLKRLERDELSESVIGADGGLRAVMEQVQQVAAGDAPVLLLGETGTGKEVIARALHQRSRRHAGPMVRVNCGAIPSELIDSELFGHEKGSFTGANSSRPGWFEQADGGTLMLDEIGELPPAAQVRFLRVLQDGTFYRVGGNKPVRADVRIVAATHRDLPTMVAAGDFREDLWYRLNIFPIRLPPLRERPGDIGPLASYFAKRASKRLVGTALDVHPENVQLLMTYDWPGNARELAAVIERAVILGRGHHLDVQRAMGMDRSEIGPTRVPEGARVEDGSLNALMMQTIESTLREVGGRIEGEGGAAARLGINPSTLRSRMRKLNIDWRKYRNLTP